VFQPVDTYTHIHNKCQKCSGVPSGEWFQVSVPWLKKGWEALD